MKKIGFLLVMPLLMMACSKQDVVAPQNTTELSSFVYQDTNISISGLQVEKKQDEQVEVRFSTMYEKSIKKIEVMHGETQNQLCSVYAVTKTTNSSSLLKYSFSTAAPKNATNYYMVRFTLTNGNWGYTPLYKCELK